MSISVLYILIPTVDMPSMGRGKSVAHAAHAANLFTYNHYVKTNEDNPPLDEVVEWHESAGGFGTTIALDIGTVEDLEALVAEARGHECLTDIVVDPTYPYLVDAEIVKLIPDSVHTLPPSRLDNGMYVCHRKQTTAAYVFGDKEALSILLGKYNLLSNDTLPRSR